MFNEINNLGTMKTFRSGKGTPSETLIKAKAIKKEAVKIIEETKKIPLTSFMKSIETPWVPIILGGGSIVLIVAVYFFMKKKKIKVKK